MKNSIFKNTLLVSITVCALIFLTAFGSPPKKSTEDILAGIDAELINADIPNITLNTLRGTSENVREALKGNVTIVSVWRSGCRYCHLEAPKLAKMAKELAKESKVKFAYVSWDEDKQDALAFKSQFNISDESIIFMDTMGETLRATHLGTDGTPTVFIINAQGKVIARTVGLREWGEKKIIKDMKILVKNLQS